MILVVLGTLLESAAMSDLAVFHLSVFSTTYMSWPLRHRRTLGPCLTRNLGLALKIWALSFYRAPWDCGKTFPLGWVVGVGVGFEGHCTYSHTGQIGQPHPHAVTERAWGGKGRAISLCAASAGVLVPVPALKSQWQPSGVGVFFLSSENAEFQKYWTNCSRTKSGIRV